MSRFLVVAGLAALCTSQAHAAVLHSPPASAAYSGTYLLCQVRNVSAAPRQITVETLAFDGSVVRGPFTAVVPPGELRSYADNDTPSASASCRVTVTGSSRSVRASAVYYDPITDRSQVVIPMD